MSQPRVFEQRQLLRGFDAFRYYPEAQIVSQGDDPASPCLTFMKQAHPAWRRGRPTDGLRCFGVHETPERVHLGARAPVLRRTLLALGLRRDNNATLLGNASSGCAVS
jgi:hypothetical protein